MGEFLLDTSGSVGPISGDRWTPSFLHWTDLSPRAQGYVEAMFASLIGPDGKALMPRDASRRGLLREARTVGFSDLAPEALALIRKDCEASRDWYEPHGDERARGALFWHDRQNGHPGFPPLTVYLNDQGKVAIRTK